MPVPLVLAGLGMGGLAASGLMNVARGYNTARMYDQFRRGYGALDSGYRRYLARQGRKINPNRALTSYYGSALKAKYNMENAELAGIGAGMGSLGAGAVTSRWFI